MPRTFTPREWLESVYLRDVFDDALAAWEADRAELTRLREQVATATTERDEARAYTKETMAALVRADGRELQLRAERDALVPPVRWALARPAMRPLVSADQEAAARAVLAALDAHTPTEVTTDDE